MNIESIFSRYARPCFFKNPDGSVIAEMSSFISPLRYKNKMYLYGVNTEIGYNPEGHYLYIGPPSADITECENGEYIECQGTRYRIDRAEKVYKGTSVFYIWAVVRKTVDLEEESE